MDLSFSPFAGATGPTLPPADVAALMAGIAARQTGSTTAGVQAGLACAAPAPHLLAPPDGAFNAVTAAAIMCWREA